MRVILRDGTVIIEKFVEKKGDFIVLENGHRFKMKEVRAFAIYKPLTGDILK